MNPATSADVAHTIFKGNPHQKAWKYIRDNNADSCNLNRIAIKTGIKEYTYGLMFRQWECYASVFSALHMTQKEHARVGMMGSIAAETIFSFYGLNMVGAEVSVISPLNCLNIERVIRTIQAEKWTDILLSDDLTMPELIQELLNKKQDLGLRNIILLHLPIGGNAANRIVTAAQESKYLYLKSLYSPICMETLLSVYGSYPVSYCDDNGCDPAVILHTSGTTKGMGKPVALSDYALNSSAGTIVEAGFSWMPKRDLICGVSVDLSNAYSLVDQIHLPLTNGGTLALIPAGALNPEFYRSIPEMKINILFCIGSMFHYWMGLPNSTEFDFSSLKNIIIGGSAISAKDKRAYYDFLHKHGCDHAVIINGYGLSELGGACCLSTQDIDDESIGYVLPGVSLLLHDEETDQFKTIHDAPCEGVLYLTSPSITSGLLDGKEIIKTEIIDGKPYICTNDTVSIDATGKITYLGRASRYFIHDKNRKFESGRVETEFLRQNEIKAAALVPVYKKTRHDNLPMLCVSIPDKTEKALERLREVFVRIYVTEKTLSSDNIPSFVMLAEELPRNAVGKIDLYGIQQGNIIGRKYEVDIRKQAEHISDIHLLPHENESEDMSKDALRGIADDIKANISRKNPFSNTNTTNTQYGMPQSWLIWQQEMNRMLASWYQMNWMAWQNMIQNMQNNQMTALFLQQLKEKSCKNPNPTGKEK